MSRTNGCSGPPSILYSSLVFGGAGLERAVPPPDVSIDDLRFQHQEHSLDRTRRARLADHDDLAFGDGEFANVN